MKQNRNEKDITEKHLGDYDDVFADIINGCYFQGRQVVKAEELEDAVPYSLYKEGRFKIA